MTKGTVAVLVGPEYEDLEVWYPKLRLEEAGYAAPLVGMGEPRYLGNHGYPCAVDGDARDLRAADLVGLLALCVVGAAVLDTAGRTVWAAVVDRAEGRLREDLVDAALHQPLSALSDQAVGEILDRVDADTHDIGSMLRRQVWDALRTVFAAVPMCVLVARWCQSVRTDSDGHGQPGGARKSFVTMCLFAAEVITIGLIVRKSPAVQWTYDQYHYGNCDWPRFFTLLKKHHLAFCQWAPTETSRLHDWLFWCPVVAVLVLGSWRLVKQRQWDRMALVVGLMIGVMLACLRDWSDPRLHSAEEVKAALGLPVLGQVPKMSGDLAPSVRGQTILVDPASEVAEACRSLRTAFHFGERGAQQLLDHRSEYGPQPFPSGVVIKPDAALLGEDRPAVSAVIDPVDSYPDLRVAVADRPQDWRRAPVPGQQRGVDVDRAESRDAVHGRRQDPVKSVDHQQIKVVSGQRPA